jgi:phosphate:Na+ symporter
MSFFIQMVELLGGLGLFLYGMRIMSDGIQRRSGPKLRKILNVLTTNRFAGIFTGFSVTALLQSSSATTVLLVSIVNAGLMGLEQSIGVVMGANIGTTFTAWIVSIVGFQFKITLIALPAIAISMPLFYSKRERRRELAAILLGFGILFLGLHTMKESVPDIRNNTEILAFLQYFSAESYVSLLLFIAVGTVLTIVVQSSSAAMAITLTMAYRGWISYPVAAAIVLGENIGTTITAYLASLGMSVNAKRTARAHMLFNLLGVGWMIAVFFPFIHAVDALIPGAAGDPNHLPIHLSAFHSAFNIANTLLLVGFVPRVSWLVKKWVPEKAAPEPMTLKLVHSHTSEDVESNLISAQAELGRMSRMVYDMSLWVMNSLDQRGDEFLETSRRVERFEETTDEIQSRINRFLTNCMVDSLNEDQANRIRSMYRVAHELENVGDGCKKIVRWLEKRSRKGYEFHEDAIAELHQLSAHVLDFEKYLDDYLSASIRRFSFQQARSMEKNLNKQRNALRKVVRKNLAEGGDVRGEMVFMDIVRHLEQMGDSCYNIAEEIVSIRDVDELD